MTIALIIADYYNTEEANRLLKNKNVDILNNKIRKIKLIRPDLKSFFYTLIKATKDREDILIHSSFVIAKLIIKAKDL